MSGRAAGWVIRPLQRTDEEGVWLSRDGRWRFVRDDWHTAAGRPSWWAYCDGIDEACNIGHAGMTLGEVAAWAERESYVEPER